MRAIWNGNPQLTKDYELTKNYQFLYLINILVLNLEIDIIFSRVLNYLFSIAQNTVSNESKLNDKYKIIFKSYRNMNVKKKFKQLIWKKEVRAAQTIYVGELEKIANH